MNWGSIFFTIKWERSRKEGEVKMEWEVEIKDGRNFTKGGIGVYEAKAN